MARIIYLFALLVTVISTPVMAAKPDLQPGMWSYTYTTSIKGPVSIKPQTMTNKECMRQQDLNKGVGMLNIPKQCTITKVNIMRDGTQFAATCNISGMSSEYQGQAKFYGDHLQGNMTSQTDTPLGKMIMDMGFTAKRIGNCS